MCHTNCWLCNCWFIKPQWLILQGVAVPINSWLKVLTVAALKVQLLCSTLPTP